VASNRTKVAKVGTWGKRQENSEGKKGPKPQAKRHEKPMKGLKRQRGREPEQNVLSVSVKIFWHHRTPRNYLKPGKRGDNMKALDEP